jgi:hypothetical protein
MKKTILILITLFLGLSAYSQEFDSFGKKIKAKGAISTSELVEKTQSSPSINAKVSGVVESVCQVKGCWMKVKLDNGQSMRVTFKDYGFFVPKDISGKTVVFDGVAKTSTTSVEELQHYAQDAGKSKEEIAKITEPKTELTFVANGVLVLKK